PARPQPLTWARAFPLEPSTGMTTFHTEARHRGTDMVSNKHASATGSAVRRAAGGGRGPGTAGQGPFAALGRVVVHHPWLTILAWVVAAVAVIATSPGLPTTTNESSFLPKSY